MKTLKETKKKKNLGIKWLPFIDKQNAIKAVNNATWQDYFLYIQTKLLTLYCLIRNLIKINFEHSILIQKQSMCSFICSMIVVAASPKKNYPQKLLGISLATAGLKNFDLLKYLRLTPCNKSIASNMWGLYLNT
eukprot:gene6540-10546_t